MTTAPPEILAYTCYAVFSRRQAAPDTVVADTTTLLDDLSAAGITVRGLYDVAGMPSSADLLVWMHGPSAAALQEAIRSFERDAFAGTADLVWSGFGVHRQAEFSREHAPAFMLGIEPKTWLTVYPFVRSYEWYLLPDEERRGMLVEHGMMGREYDQVLSNTVAAFALGDYEWLLALEADELHDTVDLMRHLRASGARRHVREEIPFFSGRRVDEASAVEVVL